MKSRLLPETGVSSLLQRRNRNRSGRKGRRRGLGAAGFAAAPKPHDFPLRAGGGVRIPMRKPDALLFILGLGLVALGQVYFLRLPQYTWDGVIFCALGALMWVLALRRAEERSDARPARPAWYRQWLADAAAHPLRTGLLGVGVLLALWAGIGARRADPAADFSPPTCAPGPWACSSTCWPSSPCPPAPLLLCPPAPLLPCPPAPLLLCPPAPLLLCPPAPLLLCASAPLLPCSSCSWPPSWPAPSLWTKSRPTSGETRAPRPWRRCACWARPWATPSPPAGTACPPCPSWSPGWG
jgi:hypothetical protein